MRVASISLLEMRDGLVEKASDRGWAILSTGDEWTRHMGRRIQLIFLRRSLANGGQVD